eukprot:4651547-Amphidinium_carterae.1
MLGVLLVNPRQLHGHLPPQSSWPPGTLAGRTTSNTTPSPSTCHLNMCIIVERCHLNKCIIVGCAVEKPSTCHLNKCIIVGDFMANSHLNRDIIARGAVDKLLVYSGFEPYTQPSLE